jgi:TRAP-type C4-dicarboxylate transport system permease small subunit
MLPRSLPLRLAVWLAIVGASLLFLLLVVGLAGWTGTIPGLIQRLAILGISLGPWALAALLVWHWAAAVLRELRLIRRSLGAIAQATEREAEGKR